MGRFALRRNRIESQLTAVFDDDDDDDDDRIK
jgi:hypothetical protein